MFLLPAQIGSATGLLEAVATSVGAGMLLSGFLMAVVGLARGRARGQIEKYSLRDACIGGLGAIGLISFDLLMRYFV